MIVNKKRLLAAILSAALTLTTVPAAVFAADEQDTDITGSLHATLRFDYPQLLATVSEKNINVTLYDKNGSAIGEIPFDGGVSGEISDRAVVTKKNTEGGVMNGEKEIGYLDITVPGLPLGDYSFEFKGDGYVPYKTPVISIDDYSRQVIVGTGGATFSIGDVNGDGKVNKKDRDLMSDELGKTDNLDVYDLNGDGEVNIVDLAYVNHQIDGTGDAQIFDTALIAQKAVKTDVINDYVNVEGSISDIFAENNQNPVSVTSKSEGGELAIPIEFNSATEMEQIEIVAPDVTGAITAGVADVTYEDERGKEITESIAFDETVPEGVSLLSVFDSSARSVVIPLGKRVAVKKVVINVTKAEGEDGTPTFAVIQEVKFLKDIVPENPVLQSLSVKNVKAEPRNESVMLTWDKFPNITGYTVYYRMEGETEELQLTVSTNSALVTGLKNLKTYHFSVVPISDDWSGGRSETVSAIPQPTSPPLKPDMIVVTPMDCALGLSWKATEDATYYKVFYKKASDKDFVQWGDKIYEPKASIGGLINDVEYELYVVAGNDIGEGPKSDLTTGVPKKTELEAPEIPTMNMIDLSNIEDVVMTDPNNVLLSEYPNGFDVHNVADGDYATHWTARVFWESNEFTFTFKEAKEMDYMVYVPRLDGNYRRSLDRYSITVWDEAGNQKQVVSGQAIPINSNETGYMILPFERTKVKKLAVSIAQWDGSPTGVSLSEVAFYEADDLEGEVRELFANDIYTELSESAKADKDAALQKIEALRARANDAAGYYVDKNALLDELALAEALLGGDTSALGIVKFGAESRSTSPDREKYMQSASDLQPLGAVAYATDYAVRTNKPQTKVTIYAHIPDGEEVYLVPTQYFAEANAWQGSGIPLQNGRNIIDIPKLGTQSSERGGALYLRYSGSKADEISLHIRLGVTKIPLLELSDWYSIDDTERRARIAAYVEELEAHTKAYRMTETGIYNSTEISMPNVLLSVAASPVLSAIKPTGADNAAAAETLYNNVLAWEEFMHVANTTQGIDNTLENSDMQSRQNIRYMRMFAKAFMYAAGAHIGIGFGSVGGTAVGKPTSMLGGDAESNGLFGWGLAHEVGHNMDKLGKAEITNNIYAILMQTYDGDKNILPSRLELENKYDDIYQKVAEGRPGMANDVFVQLGMYWQLHLAYDDGDAPLDFYNRFFKEWKSGSAEGSYDEKVALTVSKVANKNLTDFFTSWGMVLSDEVKSELGAYPAEERSIQYLNDESRRYRLSGGAEGSGTTTAEAVLDADNEKQVNLTFSTTADKAAVLGFEIKRNGRTIAFVRYNDGENASAQAGGEYTDLIGSANNRAFEYTVSAYDMLGNMIDEADAGQVRVSYVDTVDPSEYTVTKTADGLTAVMNERTAVSGVKITNAPEDGEFTVTITRTEDGENVSAVAKNGDFTKNETPDAGYYVAYFNKPGAASDDTRIWTYDAEEITVTGVPETAEVEFISYAGDDIGFYEDAAVGYLKDDYIYGEGEDEVIKAGTLVVTGTYRGDPLYNTIQVNGRFTSVNPETNEESVIERAIDGYSLLFAEIPEDGEVSDISDGFFIFVPDVQAEAELQGEVPDCSAESLLPAWIKAEIYRTDTIESVDSRRLTSDTVWISSPSEDSMPEIILK